MYQMNDTTAFVLAGGRSSRMGADKAFLEFGGGTLLARAVAVASAVGPVKIVGSREKFEKHGTVVTDIFPGHGPLGGIHAALRSSATELNLVLAVDMPFVVPRFLGFLVERARKNRALATVPRARQHAGSSEGTRNWDAGQLQPLCAVYRREFAEIAEQALGDGRNKIDPLFAPEITNIIEASEMERLAFSPTMFDNLNTSEDLERARLSLQESR
jgi:molybdopterin-guanine dinucleotide biosynthesis protein A